MPHMPCAPKPPPAVKAPPPPAPPGDASPALVPSPAGMGFAQLACKLRDQGPELTAEMYNVSLMRVNGCLYALGTSETQRSPFRIHRYNVVCRLDPAARRWVQLESDLCDVRSFASVAARLYTRKLSQVFRPEVDT